MIPKGMEYDKAQVRLQEIAQVARDILKPVKDHPGSDVDLIISKLWSAFCSGGESAYKNAHDSLASAYKQAADAVDKAEKLLASAKSPTLVRPSTDK